jgi:hypothetical protein
VPSFPSVRVYLQLKLLRSLLLTSRLVCLARLTSRSTSPSTFILPPRYSRNDCCSTPTMPIWDPLVPAERVIQRGLSRLPPWISRWLGYRGTNLPPSRTWIVCLWGFIGAFGGVASIIAVFAHTSYFHNIHLVPPIVASFVSIERMKLTTMSLTLVSGCFSNSLLRRHRRPPGATTIPHLWPLLQRTHWRYHGDHLPV